MGGHSPALGGANLPSGLGRGMEGHLFHFPPLPFHIPRNKNRCFFHVSEICVPPHLISRPSGMEKRESKKKRRERKEENYDVCNGGEGGGKEEEEEEEGEAFIDETVLLSQG